MRALHKISVCIPEHIWTHPAYRALQPIERVLLIELLALAHRVGTNEPLVCSCAMTANMLNVPKSVAARALLSLRKKGFIACVRSGDRRRANPTGIASEYRVTCLSYQGAPPTSEYNRIYWKAVDQGVLKGMKFTLSEASLLTSDGSEQCTADSKSALICAPPAGHPLRTH